MQKMKMKRKMKKRQKKMRDVPANEIQKSKFKCIPKEMRLKPRKSQCFKT